MQGVMGTSAGALTGALFCAGYTPDQVAAELGRVPPITLMRPNYRPWAGVMSLEGVIERLREVLPPSFEDLERPLAVGVVDRHGNHRLIKSGRLPEAVAASACVPGIFAPVDIPGSHQPLGPFIDGGMKDRVGLEAWRQVVTEQRDISLVHIIHRSSPFSGPDDVQTSVENKLFVFKSPKSNFSLFDSANRTAAWEEQMEDTYVRTTDQLIRVRQRADHNDESPLLENQSANYQTTAEINNVRHHH